MQLLINETVRIFSLCRDHLWSQLEEQKSTHPDFINFTHAQLYFIADRSQSLIVLIQAVRLWDAEIIMRSIMEATIRVLYVCYSSESERTQRINEFWNDLAEINELKRSERAKTILQHFGQKQGNEVAIKPLILSADKEKELRDKWPKKRRQALEQKWSFSEILFFLEKSMDADKGGAFIRSTLHNYGFSSHLIHADESGLSLLWDRNHRPDEEREKLAIAHMCRMLGDSLSYLFLVWNALVEALKLDKNDLETTYQEAQRLFQQFNIGAKDFYRTQKTQ
jgi:hypothetical protein